MMFIAKAVDNRLDRRIKNFDHGDQQYAANQQRLLDAVTTQVKPQWNHYQREQDLLSERSLVAPGRTQSLPAIAASLDDSGKALVAGISHADYRRLAQNPA